ncbi:MAG TPA: hypothetical protein VLW25_08270 [Bryobacteraceae bacterium]|nr:hypothetical protein [Bryobacteraceae bacterium]
MLKYCAVLSLCAGLGLSQQFITNQAARLVIGQTTFTSQQFIGDTEISSPLNTLLGSAGGVAYAGDTLFVADSNRMGMEPIMNRVLIFNQVAESWPTPTQAIAPYAARCPVCVGAANVVLGQPDFTGPPADAIDTSFNPARSQNGMNLPVAVASDGVHLAVADTANNRVLIWNEIPATNNQNADIVLGQPDFTTLQVPPPVNSSAMRAPQGVWFGAGKFWVADTQNNRVLVWNSVPTKNNQPADMVLGAPNFTTVPNNDQTTSTVYPAANNMLSPTSVTTDGVHVFVSDLGFSRILIWNEIPTQNGQPADLELGQVNFTYGVANDNTDICASNGTDSNGNPTYPSECGQTLNFPRFALSDGTRLYVADGGNDRVLIYNTIPTVNDAEPDEILGQPDEFSNVTTSNGSQFEPDLSLSASNATTTPTALAWDGTNLYVADPNDFRILVFTPENPVVQQNGVVNSASLAIFAFGTVTMGGTITAGDTITITVNSATYTYKVVSSDTFETIVSNFVSMINGANNGAGDPSVIARDLTGFGTLELISRVPGPAGNNVTIGATVSTNATETATASAGTLSGGGSASTLGPGTIVQIQGSNLADTTASVPTDAQTWPLDLGGVEVYVDGIRSPISYVSPNAINAQVPYELVNSNSSSLYVRTQHSDGSVTVTDAVGLPIANDNPGIYAQSGPEPRVAFAYHGSSFATGTVSVDGTINPGDTATVNIQDRSYSYTVQSTDTLAVIRDALIELINTNPSEVVVASAANAYTRIRLRAKVPGPEGDGISFSGTSSGEAAGSAGSVTITAFNSALCCANVAGAPITAENPAQAGETIYVFATGLGLVTPVSAKNAIVDGSAYTGPAANNAADPVSSLAGGANANVISAGLAEGMVGIYQVVLELSNALATNANTQLTISQDIYTSNVVSLPVYQPSPPAASSGS